MKTIEAIKSKLQAFNDMKKNQAPIKERENLITELKKLYLQLKSIPPAFQPPNEKELILALNVIENEMEFALERGKDNEFERAYLKSKQFYFDLSEEFPVLKTDKRLYYIALYLLHLLSHNKLTEFSNEIELLDTNDLNDKYIKVSRNLEQSIMEGNYKNLQNIKESKESQDSFIKYYLDKFDDAIRYQIAKCAEKAYDSISIEDSKNILMLKDLKELENFITQINTEKEGEKKEIEWKISGNRIMFINLNKEKEVIPANRIINDTVKLGIEIEKIV